MFERIEVPTPFQVGSVNAYLAGETLIDPGPGTEEAWEALKEKLDERGTDIDDIERVMITHPHPDHFGLASRLSENGADILASHECAEIISDFEARYRYERDFFVGFFVDNGMPSQTAKTVTELPQAFLDLSPPVETDRVLRDGDSVEVDGTEVVSEIASGHAPGELVYIYDDSEGSKAVVGDHVLGNITPNPLLQPPQEEGGDRPRVLVNYNRSLERLRDHVKHFVSFLPGHREVIENPQERIDEILDEHEERTQNVLEIVSSPKTAVEVMHELFDDLPATEYFPGMSEAVGHLDVLEERELVEKRVEDGEIVYEAV